LLIVGVGGANLSGALFVLLFATFVMPDPPGLADPEHIRLINMVVFSAYVIFGAPFGVTWGVRLFRPLRSFAGHERAPSEAERRAVLRGPLRLMAMEATLWGFGAFAWAAIDLTFSRRAVADPVRSVREGLSRIERGDLQAAVPVYDASELGGLQAGFNHMAAGLRENERVRDLFGRHVGEDVARHALEHGVALGGEVREAAVIFTDLKGSTRLAASRPPGEVVALLNAYFGIVVEVVSAYGGLINKFQGDAALAIFGAPQPLEDPAGQALAAARELARRLRAELPQLPAR
jgi:class 3 adenylate cyclase